MLSVCKDAYSEAITMLNESTPTVRLGWSSWALLPPAYLALRTEQALDTNGGNESKNGDNQELCDIYCVLETTPGASRYLKPPNKHVL